MTPKEALQKIKALFNSQAFAEHSLADGSKVSIDKLEVGGKAEITKEDGSTAPATGELELADGTKVTLDENGVITAVTPKEQLAVEPKEYSLTDGSKVKIDKLEAGGLLTKTNSDGSATMATAGVYVLADGTSVTTDDTGMITLVAPKEAEVEMKTTEQMQAFLNSFADGVTPDINKIALVLKAVFENVMGWQLREAQNKKLNEEAIAVYQTGFTALQKENNDLKAVFGQMVELVETLVEEPGADPIEPQKTFMSENTDKKRSRFDILVKATEKK